MPDDYAIPMGIDAATGRPLLADLTPEELADWILKSFGGELELAPPAVKDPKSDKEVLGLPAGVTPSDLGQAGWGVVWAPGTSAQICESLAPLINLRKSQTGSLFKEIHLETDQNGQIESVAAFMQRHGVSPGLAQPEKLPFYLLIVASPEAVPYEFQYAINVDYTTGRLYFETAEQYNTYAKAAVKADNEVLPRNSKELLIFGPDNDTPTTLSRNHLVMPVQESFNRKLSGRWTTRSLLGENATRARLITSLNNANRPRLVFSASHGIEFEAGHPDQTGRQGSILCQDWEGGPVEPDVCFGSAEVSELGDLSQLIWFAFACFGAGTPVTDSYPGKQDLMAQRQISERPFCALMPQSLLSHPPGAALAFVGHVDRVWATSFLFGKAGPQVADFVECLERLANGDRLGFAMRVFGERYASWSTWVCWEIIRLLRSKGDLDRRRAVDLCVYWTSCMDARNFIILGDPAVRLRM